MQLPNVIERCRKDLALSSRREGGLGELLAALASSTLLLAVAAMSPKHALAEYIRLAYNETTEVAQRNGLLTPHIGEELSATFSNFYPAMILYQRDVKRFTLGCITTWCAYY